MFITYFKKNEIEEKIFESFLFGETNIETKKDTNDWKTIYVQEKLLFCGVDIVVSKKNRTKWLLKARKLAKEAEEIQERIPIENRFRVYEIPKKSGGMRKIEEPIPEVMSFLNKVKDFLEIDMKFHPHPSSFAYVKQKNTLDAIKVHQSAENQWFLKLDFHDFFGSITLPLTLEHLWEIYPFGYMWKLGNFKEDMEKMLSVAFNREGLLPQGTPLSPTLSNICMLRSDFEITESCERRGITYTRYADDLLFSAKEKSSLFLVKGWVEHVTPKEFKLNTEKTRLGSIAGRNWNLGLMLNKDNNITVGKKNKDVMRATLYQMAMKIKNREPVGPEATSKFVGLYNYYRYIEPEYFDKITSRIVSKTGINLFEVFHLSGKSVNQ